MVVAQNHASMKFFYLALVLLPAVMPSENEPVHKFNYFIEHPETGYKEEVQGKDKYHIWHRQGTTQSPEKWEMERNGKLKGPKIFVPNPSFEINMGKPWHIVGDGVEVVKDESLSRKGKNSL